MTDPAYDDRRAAPDVGSEPGERVRSRPVQIAISDSDVGSPAIRFPSPGESPAAPQEDADASPRPAPAAKGCYFGYPSGSCPLEGYTIKRGIGTGGFGEVYFAVSDAGKEVALKRILRNVDIELRGVKQCLNLKHVHLVSLFDIRQDQHGQTWVVMEYVAGECLKDVLDRNPHGLPDDEVDFWMLGICLGVGYLHDRGIVHRDLKPGNLFLDEGVVKIGDYGLSKFISRSQRVGQTQSVGTFHYMAPEIGRGEYGREVDVYALGVMLFELTTGTLPFLGESSQEIALKHLTATPDVSPVPERYQAIVEKCLRKEPTDRYSRVEELLVALSLPTGHGIASYSWVRRRETDPRDDRATDPDLEPSRRRPVDRAPSRVAQILDEVDDGIAFGEVRQSPDANEPEVRRDHRPGNPFRDGWSTAGEVPTPHVALSAPASLLIEPHDPQEPIARALRKQWRRATEWWTGSRMSTPAKVALLVAAVALVLLNSQWLLPLLVIVGIIYFPYYAGRAVWLALTGNFDRLDVRESETVDPLLSGDVSFAPSRGDALSVVPAYAKKTSLEKGPVEKVPPGKTPIGKKSREEAPSKETVPAKRPREERKGFVAWLLVSLGLAPGPQSRSLRQHIERLPASVRLGELIASLLMATAAVAFLSLLALAVGGRAMSRDVDTLSFYLWLAITAGFGSWAMVALGKLWETRAEEPLVRRIASALVGTATGAVSFAIASYLDVPLADELRIPFFPQLVGPEALGEQAHAVGAAAFGIASFLAYFAAAFALPHWWRQVDPQRKTRLALMTVCGCVLWALLLQPLVPFAQPWGFLAIGMVSVAGQLSAPWFSAAARARIRAKAKTASLRRHAPTA